MPDSRPVSQLETSPVMVSSAQLVRSADHLKGRLGVVAATQTKVSKSQLLTAARLLREAEPSVITHVNGGRVLDQQPQERPGWICPDDDPKVLRFHVGIIPATTYRIDRRGRVLS